MPDKEKTQIPSADEWDKTDLPDGSIQFSNAPVKNTLTNEAKVALMTYTVKIPKSEHKSGQLIFRNWERGGYYRVYTGDPDYWVCTGSKEFGVSPSGSDKTFWCDGSVDNTNYGFKTYD